jgi:hypothetical protein
MMLVTLAQAKLRLRIDSDDSDGDLELMIAGASRACVRYLKTGADVFLDSAGDPHLDSNGDALGVPEDVANAVLMLVGIWRRDPDGVDSEKWAQGYLPGPVTAILYPLRIPTLA